MENKFLEKKLLRPFMVAVTGIIFGGCSTAPMDNLLTIEGKTNVMQQVMAQKDKIIWLSSQEIRRDKPVLLLLHGATDDPTEMLEIYKEWRWKYNVCLYSYNFHRSIKKVAADLAGEMKILQAENNPNENVTVITFSYSAIVFRMAVIIADDPALFSNVTLIQLVPTAGGSFVARGMGFPVVASLVFPFSKPSVAENPYGSLAKKLWDGEGNRKFYEAINPARMRTILLEGDPNSLDDVKDEKGHRRYESGIGTNVIIIPKSLGVTHEYFPTNSIGLEYLRKLLEPNAK